MTRPSTPTLLILGLVTSLAAGCSSFQRGTLRNDLGRAPSSPQRPDPAEIVERVRQDHAQRASLIQGLKVADLNISIENYRDAKGRDRSPLVGGTARGTMVLQRPRDLRIMLRKLPSMAVADIGSNDREFWFANDMAHELTVGDYAEVEGRSDPFLASIRPDWIFEVLGLEPIPADVEIEPGSNENSLTLVEQRRLPDGTVLVKESVLNLVEQRIVEHRLYADGREDLIARAQLGPWKRYSISEGPGVAPSTVELPGKIQLTIPEVASLSMTLGGVTPNPTDDFEAATTFDRPAKQGYVTRDILELTEQPGRLLAEADGPTIEPAPERLAVATADPPAPAPRPRSDAAIARVEDEATTPSIPDAEERQRPVVRDAPITLDLPSPSPVPDAADGLQRSTSWERIDGNRFRRGSLGGG